MLRVSRRLYWMAVTSNVVALATLLRGTMTPMSKPEQMLMPAKLRGTAPLMPLCGSLKPVELSARAEPWEGDGAKRF